MQDVPACHLCFLIIKALKSSYEAGKISFDDTVQSTETAVRKSFYRLLYLKHALETGRSTL